MSDGLFNPEAFEQMPGQMSMEQDEAVRAFNENEARYEATRARVTCAECGCESSPTVCVWCGRCS